MSAAKSVAVAIGPSFGWFHHAHGDRGVVMCSAMGYEALCAHNAWRVLADRLAAAGMPTLRFDYPGAGDSLGEADDPAFLENCRDSIRAAVDWMRRTAGVREIAVVGMRLGAALAAEVGDVDHLVQLAPVVKGSAYVRELKVMARMLAASKPDSQPETSSGDDIDLEGFSITPQVAEALKRIDLIRLTQRPAPRILVMTDPAASAHSAYMSRLDALGAVVESRNMLDYPAFAPAPLPSPAPLADLDAIVAWTRDGASSAWVEAPAESSLATKTFTERGVLFGPEQSLAGVLCEPWGVPVNSTVVLLNTGANYHIGCGRSSVDYARALGAMGVASLRMDSFGIGDSEWVEGGPRSVLYHEERHRDVSHALDFLDSRGLHNVTLMGVCSGAALALYTALKDQRIQGLMLANIMVFNRLDQAAIDAMLNAAFGATSTYVAKAMSARSWARVFNGEVPVSKLFAIGAAVLRRRVAALVGAFGNVGRLSSKAREAHENLLALSRRGVRVLILHGDQDAGLEELETCFGPGGQRARTLPGVKLDTLHGVDHALSSRHSRELLLDRLTAFICSNERRPEAHPRERSVSLFSAATAVALGVYSQMGDLQ